MTLMRRKPAPADVLIVGSGASGATAAKVLTEAGINVVCLERGPWIKPDEFSGDELKYVNRYFLWQDLDLKPRTKRSSAGEEAHIARFSPTPQMVGGASVHYSGWVPRPTPDDLISKSIYGDIPGASLVDWPVTYDELEPYWTKVEWEFGVCGLAGANKYEGPRSKGYPTPPYPVNGFGKKFYEGCAKMGLNAFPLPKALLTAPHKGRPASVQPGLWHEYGDPTGSKSTPLSTFIPEALATGRYDLRPESYVREITVSKDGRASGVVYQDRDGVEYHQEAKMVLLACGAIETARLMLLSKSALFPDGIANNSGLVGKNAMFHEYIGAFGLFDKELSTPTEQWTGSYVNGATYEFYKTDTNRDHILGSVTAASTVGHPINFTYPGKPLWGKPAKDADRQYFDYSMKIGAILQDIPQETNAVDLDPTVRDAWGLPVARITAKPHENDKAQAKYIADNSSELMRAAGASKVDPIYLSEFTGNCSHEMGTARMGNDPSSSVVNKWGAAHDVPNLYVLDGAVFPTSLGANPTLTIMANAWRIADRIIEDRP
ncbi:choline dehydrogenase-like flavoprotein [Arthrobacter sp. SLBN-100]|uniref:GMC family oxidoreductase n=1 Tax=Arthrobacter sp. SLBN-100 TaxID=2768450 RepID=UPI0011518940|nr:GMC family oxidoreductase [Arthrobacter sp. SLBN-100]TQJ68421.1 choline dehydrogenase-like flavoprotein [Arthrobacter sp. SLBN-100]